MKRLLKILLLAVLCMGFAISGLACAGNDPAEPEVGIFCKKFQGDTTYTVYKYVDDGVTTLNIEEAVKAKYGANAVVGRIKENSFVDNAKLTSIIVPTTVTEIDAGAFSKMRALEEITLPFIGGSANADATIMATKPAENKSVDFARTFGYIFGLEAYDYGAKITGNYGAGTQEFYIPASLIKVTISANAGYKIPAYAFAGVGQINQVVLNENITEIGEFAFNKAISVQSLEIPASVTKIHNNAFSENATLTAVTFKAESALASIGEKAFYKTGVRKITLPAVSAITVGDLAFSYCQGLTKVEKKATTTVNSGLYIFEGTDVTAFTDIAE